MADETTAPDRRDVELYAHARVVMLDAINTALPELARLGLNGDPIAEPVDRIAWAAARALVERTVTAQPFDGRDLEAVASALTAAFLEYHVGTLRGFVARVAMSR
jgi:hypothetical protein